MHVKGNYRSPETATVQPVNNAVQAVENDLPAVAIGASAARLVRDSFAPNTRRCYAGQLRRLDAWLSERGESLATLDDGLLADYLGKLDDDGMSAATARLAVSAVRSWAKVTDRASPAGRITDMALRGFGREGRAERGRGQAPALDIDTIRLMAEKADKRDRAMIWVLFQACLRRSEAAALEWRDVEAGKGGLRIRVRKSKTNQDGGLDDIRFVKAEAARALLAIQPDEPNPDASVFGMSPSTVNRRFKAAASRCGVQATAHSARVTYASELTRLGASTIELMRSGGWQTERMVGHYASGVMAEHNATAKYL